MIEVASERENNSNIVTYLYGVLTMAQALSNCFILSSSLNLRSNLVNVHCLYFIDGETDAQRGPVIQTLMKGVVLFCTSLQTLPVTSTFLSVAGEIR